jgi:hypothetical protein
MQVPGFGPVAEVPSAWLRTGSFVSAKGPKTIDAPPVLIRLDGRKAQEGGPTRQAQTRPAD